MQTNILSFPAPASKAHKSRKQPITRSSWIADVKYRNGFLVAFTKKDGVFIFEGVPSEVCGLVLAGTGGRSVGHALHRLLREVDEKSGKLGNWKYSYQYIKDQKQVKELKEIMK